MKSEIPSAVIEDVRRQYHAAAGRSEKKLVVERVSNHLGVSKATLLRKLDLRLRTRRVSPKAQERMDEVNALAQAVWRFKELKRADDKVNTLRAAHRVLQNLGQVPGWFTEKMCYDAVDRLSLKNQSLEATMRFKEFEREHPRSMYQADFTKSDYLKITGMANGVPTIVLTNGRWSRTEDESVWIGGAIDDASRVCYMEYILTPGENAVMTQEFLVRAMGRKGGMPLLQAVPNELYVDRGPGFESDATQVGLRALGIRHIHGADHPGTNKTNKQARGKIESLNRHVKSDFEQLLHMTYGVGHRFTLGELNQLLHEWCEAQNQREHPTRAGETKWNIFEQGLAEAKWLPENALAAFSKTHFATVRRRMIRTGRHEYYQAPSFINEGVRVQVSVRRDAVYAMWEGSEIRLTPQSIKDPARRVKIAKMNAVLDRAEKEQDRFEGIALRERFNAELQKVTAGELEIASLDADAKEDIKSFFTGSHTLAEIREAVDGVKVRVLMPAEVAAIESRAERATDRPAKGRAHIIQYDPSKYH